VTVPTPGPGAPLQVPGFELSELLGVGATSTVWLGTRTSTGERFAVKVIRTEHLHVGQLLELSDRLAALLGRVGHEHLVRLHEAHPLADGSVAQVLDLADGGTLTELLAARGRLEPGEVATICTPIAGALAAIHAAGVVHGGLTPDKVLFTREGKPLLALGSAARLAEERHSPTVAGASGFLAPELLAGDLPSPASDVYALGALVWFALTGRALLPQPGSSPQAAPVALSPAADEATPVVGSAFAPVVAQLLAADPRVRPEADEAAIACYEAADPRPVRLVPRPAPVPAPPGAGGPSPVASVARSAGTVESPAAPTAANAGTAGPAGPPGMPPAHPAAPAVGVPAVSQVPTPTGRPGPAAPQLPTTGAVSRPGQAGAAGAPRPGRATAGPLPRRGGGIPVAGRVAIVLAGALLLAAAILALMWRQPSTTAAAAQSAVAATSTSSATSDADVSDRRGDARTVVQAVADARAAALVAGDPQRLTQADAPGSPMLANDTTILDSLRRDGRRYADLRFTVTHAEWVGGDATTATVLAVVDRAAYRVVAADTTVTTVPAEAGRPFTYTLTWTNAGWRLVTVTG